MIDWINCKDNMPDEGTEVLVWTSRGPRVGRYSKGGFWSVQDHWRYIDVTHWAFIDPPIEAESVAKKGGGS